MKQNYFEFFKLPVQFELDLNNLAERHRAIISKIHPDRYAAASAAEQRMALQWSTFANEAFETLKTPVRRAKYLLELAAPELKENRVHLPHAFLMQQMEWREALEEGQIEQVRAEVMTLNEKTLAALNAACVEQDWTEVQVHLAECQFIENFLAQI